MEPDGRHTVGKEERKRDLPHRPRSEFCAIELNPTELKSLKITLSRGMILLDKKSFFFVLDAPSIKDEAFTSI